MQSILKLISIKCAGECGQSQTNECYEFVNLDIHNGFVDHQDDLAGVPCEPTSVGSLSRAPSRTQTGQIVELDCSGTQYAFKTWDVLGEGSYGCVYLGISRSSSEKCAIKHIPKANPLLVATALDEVANKCDKHVGALRQEVIILRTLCHPHIIRLVDSSEDFRNFYLVLEHCSGGKLTEFIDNKKVCPDFLESDASLILQHVMAAVQYLHGKFLCHRDIKPDNIILKSAKPMIHNKAKLIDFGLACECRPGEILQDVVGTPLYMAPQVVERRYDLAADIWSSGVTTYQLLSGKLPFRASSRDSVMKLVRRGNYAFNGEEWHDISDLAKDFVRGMMTVVAKARWSAEKAAAHKWVTQHTPDRLRRL